MGRNLLMVLAFASVAAVQRATGVEAAVSTAAAASLSAAVSLQTIREHIKPVSMIRDGWLDICTFKHLYRQAPYAASVHINVFVQAEGHRCGLEAAALRPSAQLQLHCLAGHHGVCCCCRQAVATLSQLPPPATTTLTTTPTTRRSTTGTCSCRTPEEVSSVQASTSVLPTWQQAFRACIQRSCRWPDHGLTNKMKR